MNRILAAIVGTGVATVVALAPATSAVAQAAAVPTHTSVVDAKNDVTGAKSGKSDLDLRKVSAALVGDNIEVTVKVADLKESHLAEIPAAGGYMFVPTSISAYLYFGKTRWQVLYGPGGIPGAVAVDLSTNAELDNPKNDCLDENGVTRFAQAADYDANTVTFTIPVECLPTESKTARVSGLVFTRNYASISDTTKKSKPFSFR